MKTVQSFFPTTTKSKASFRKDVTYKVMKKVQTQNNLELQQEKPRSKFSQQIYPHTAKAQNIFRNKNNSVKNYSIDQNNERPIGGLDLFRKMQKANHLNIEESTRRISKKGSRKNINLSRQKVVTSQSRSHHHVHIPQKDNVYDEFKDQTFKQHSDCKDKYNTFNLVDHLNPSMSTGKYQSQPGTAFKMSRKCSTSEEKYGRGQRKYSSRLLKETSKGLALQSGKSSSVQSLCQISQTDKKQIRWASQQQKNYLDKMAILNEINYNKPLIQKLGGKYFECLLRNRYMDEPQYNHKSPYIYQIKEKLADTKFISKIKSMKCNFLERGKIVVKGRNKMSKEQQDKMEVKQGKRRWEDWNEEEFQE